MLKKLRTKILPIILLLSLLVGCNSPQFEFKAIDEVTNEYSHYDLYKIEFPSNWTIDKEEDDSISFYAPIENETDNYIDSVNISVYENTEAWTTGGETVQAYTAELNKDNGDYTILESVISNIGGNEARKVVYSTPNGELDMNLLQVWTIKDDLLYLIVLFSEADDYEDYSNTAQEMIDSFEFL